jgi:outer membrane protein OmpA-like peptidoglycan-associated protein
MLMKMNKLAVSLGTVALAVSLSACTGLDYNHERALNQQVGIEVEQTPDGVQVRLPERVLFNFDKADLRVDAGPPINRAVVLMKRSDKPIIVEGHTDNVGTHEYNQQLSEARAQTVARALVLHGIAPPRITTRGYAYDRPAFSNDTADGRQRNRRVELVIVGESEDAIMGRK